MSLFVCRSLVLNVASGSRTPLALVAVSPNARYVAEGTKVGLRYGTDDRGMQLRLLWEHENPIAPPAYPLLASKRLKGELTHSYRCADYHHCYSLSLLPGANALPKVLMWRLLPAANRGLPLALHFFKLADKTVLPTADVPLTISSLAFTDCSCTFPFDNVEFLRVLTSVKYIYFHWDTSAGGVLEDGLVGALALLPNVETAYFSNVAKGFEDVSWMQPCKSLRSVFFEKCRELRCLEGLRTVQHLHSLSVINCVSITSWGAVQSCTTLVHLHLCLCPEMKTISLDGLTSLRYLYLGYCSQLTSVSLVECHRLEHLTVEHSDKVYSIDGTTAKQGLCEIRVRYCDRLPVLHVSGCDALEKLDLRFCGSLQSVVGVENLRALTDLTVNGDEALRCVSAHRDREGNLDTAGFERMTWCSTLQRLFLGHCHSVTTLDISSLAQLQDLTVANCENLSSISGLAALQKLRRLYITRCNRLSRVDVAGSVWLQSVEISWCDSLRSVTGLTGKAVLQQITLYRCKAVPELDLNGCAALLQCECDICDALTTISGLATASRLYRLDLRDCPVLSSVDTYLSRCLLEIEAMECPYLTKSFKGFHYYWHRDNTSESDGDKESDSS